MPGNPFTFLKLLVISTLLTFPCPAEDEPNHAANRAAAEKAFKEKATPFLKNYCIGCHGNRRSKGGLNFEASLNSPGGPAAIRLWEKAVANVMANDMPPDDHHKQPSDEDRKNFKTWMGQIKYLSPKDPGLFVIRRLNRMEYGNTLHDLLGVDPKIADQLPEEVFGEGYLNNLSPLQTEQFLQITREVLDQILAPEDKTPTEVQRRLFGATPSSEADYRNAAKEVSRRIARQAYRRPPSSDELETLLRVFDLGRENKLSYQGSLRLMLKAILVSPQFLFITPAIEKESKEKIVPLDNHQLASRLSYLLWATMPDAELSAVADKGTLQDPAVLRSQVTRMLRDKRSRALFDGFGAQWLGLVDIQTRTFDPGMFPQMTPQMREAMYQEARLFFEHIIRENQSVVRFIDSDYTFLNESLATLYGLEKTITGPEMRRVTLNNSNRGGLLGMPGVLASTSFPNRTSPVNRGVWVLEKILGEHVPPPPPDVPALEKQNPEKIENLTLRQRNELHQNDPTCANCHKILDPIGFGLENFDAIGRWREKDTSGGPIDSAGHLPGGIKFASPGELKALLATRKNEIARNLTERLLAYALCRQLEGYDEIVVDQLMTTIKKDDYRIQTIISGIVTSYPFTHHRIQN